MQPIAVLNLFVELDKALESIRLTPYQMKILKHLAMIARGQESISISFRDLGSELLPDRDGKKAGKAIRDTVKGLEAWQRKTGILFFEREPGRTENKGSATVYIPSKYRLVRLQTLARAYLLDSHDQLLEAIREISNLQFSAFKPIEKTPKPWMESPEQLNREFKTAVTYGTRYIRLALLLGIENPEKQFMRDFKKKINEVAKPVTEAHKRDSLIKKMEAERPLLATDLDDAE
jgi:hypothetical protein